MTNVKATTLHLWRTGINRLHKWRHGTDLPIDFQFSGQNEFKINNLNLSVPFDTYKKCLTDDILDIIILETNRYAV